MTQSINQLVIPEKMSCELFPIVSVIFFSLSFLINEASLGFKLLVGQKKEFKEPTD